MEGFHPLVNFALKSIGFGLVSLVRATQNSQTFHLDNFHAPYTRNLVTLTKEGSYLLVHLCQSNGVNYGIAAPVRFARVFVPQDDKFMSRGACELRALDYFIELNYSIKIYS